MESSSLGHEELRAFLESVNTMLNQIQRSLTISDPAILYFSVGMDLGNKIASDSFYEKRQIKTHTLNPNPNPNRNPNPLKWIQHY